MKKGLFAMAAGMILLISCNQTKESDDQMGEAKRNAENSKAVYQAIESGDVSKLDSFIAKDFIDHDANNGKDIVGRDSVKAFLASIHNYFDNLKFEIISEATSQDGNYHYSLIRMTGKSKANPWGMPVGMDMDDMGIDVVKLKDGVATEHWSFTSQKDIMEMMQGMSQGSNPPSSDMKKDSAQ